MTMQISSPTADEIRQQVHLALSEDIGRGDVTAQLIDQSVATQADVICQQAAVICGIEWFNQVFQSLHENIQIQWHIQEGESVPAGKIICSLQGNARSLLTGERTALNFLQTLSATATQTRQYVEAVSHTDCQILDTRKTIPGLRLAQKYAVRCGGGNNHRTGLYDMILIKENHIAASGSIHNAVTQARDLYPDLPLEVEVENLDELQQALTCQVDRIMLDNMDLQMLNEAVTQAAGKIPLEASGGVDIDSIRAIAETGVDFISIGSITKHLHAIDLSMRFT